MGDATLTTSGTKPVLRFERFLPRPVEDVWRAVTDPAELRAWFPTRIEIDRWEPGVTFTHHFDDPAFPDLPGTVLECDAPHRLVFTWGEDTIGFALFPAPGGTTFVLTEELGPSRAARNAAGWETCLSRLVGDVDGVDAWTTRFEHYNRAYEPVLGAQEGPPVAAHA